MAPRYYVMMLLAFMVVVPYLVWRAHDYSELPGGCGVKSLPEAYADNNFKDSGRALFMTNCAACHNMIRDAAGPAMIGILNNRAPGFLYTFLTHRKALRTDKQTQERQKMYERPCMEFPRLTKDEVRKLENYIRGYKMRIVAQGS